LDAVSRFRRLYVDAVAWIECRPLRALVIPTLDCRPFRVNELDRLVSSRSRGAMAGRGAIHQKRDFLVML
jgi:hypothetical protein